MCRLQPCISKDERILAQSLASWLLDIGDDITGEPDVAMMTKVLRGSAFLINTVLRMMTKAIICPRNDTADIINLRILEMVGEESINYESSDDVAPLGCDGSAVELMYIH
ncbi:hypothetical protein Tco_0251802 [Tanacetum coccineum]